jgi:hypothetical protein
MGEKREQAADSRHQEEADTREQIADSRQPTSDIR